MSDHIDAELDLPQLYKRHVFACHTQRPPAHPRGSCAGAGALPLWERLGRLVEADGTREIGFTASGCMGFCAAGPLMVVYPDGVWYRPATVEDIDEIFQVHLKGGRRVDRLVMILSR